jgi:hypothetical protein
LVGRRNTPFSLHPSAFILDFPPWGELRDNVNSLPTDNTFTGQKWSADTGLYFFNARWYDP